MLPKVTPKNYFDRDIQMAYMGSSQFKAFDRCEAAALAEIRGEYTPPQSTSLLVGSFVDAWFSGDVDVFTKEHPAMFRKDGGLKAEYSLAMEIVGRMDDDILYSLLMYGNRQEIRTGEIAGVPFKIKIDSLLDEATCEAIAREFPDAAPALGFCTGAIIDQKVMRDTEDVWSEVDGMRIPFWRAWGYDIQGAIYQAVEGHMLPVILAVGTKENPPDLRAIHLNDRTLSAALCEVEERAPRYQAIKEGKVEPRRCEKCAWCRATRSLTSIVDCEAMEAFE